MPMGKIRDLMKDQGPYNSVNYPTVNAVQNRGLPCNGVVVEFCTFGDYNDTHKVCACALIYFHLLINATEQLQCRARHIYIPMA